MHRISQGSLKKLQPVQTAFTPSRRLVQGASLPSWNKRWAHSDYGSGDPQPGKNPSEHIEHPGPPPPDTGKATSTGNTDKGKPAIHSEQLDGTGGDESVRKHNEEMEKRAAKSHDKHSTNDPKDKVEKGFWRGEGDQ